MANYNKPYNKPKFSAGIVTLVITACWLVVFGLVVHHGLNGIHQHDSVLQASTPAPVPAPAK